VVRNVGCTSVDQDLVTVAWTLGASRRQAFVWIVLPLARVGILTGIVLSFAHTIGAFGVVLMVGGNIAGSTRTVSIAISDDVQALHYSAAGETALYLLAFSFGVLALAYGLQRRRAEG
jgi:molybdate transport system permease protein